LPLYLQKAGRYDEAMSIFEDILLRCRNSIEPSNLAFYYGEAIVYDKMRLVAKRQKKNSAVIVYAILSHAAECLNALKRARDSKKELERVTHLDLPTGGESRKKSYIEFRDDRHQEDIDHFNRQNSSFKWDEVVKETVSKTGYESLSNEILSMCLAFSKECTRDNFFKLERSISELVLHL